MNHHTIEEFWYWCNERHRIYLKRKAGEPAPWTDDPVLRTYRFTNVFRCLDRGTAFLWNRILNKCTTYEDVMLNTVAYRVFNEPLTVDVLWPEDATLRAHDWPVQRIYFAKRCEDAKSRGIKLYRGAYILKGPWKKTLAIIDQCAQHVKEWVPYMRQSVIINDVAGIHMELAYDWAKSLHGVGQFTAHQLCQDLRHPNGPMHDAVDGGTWSKIGPGSRRGLEMMGMKPIYESMLDIYQGQAAYRQPHLPELEVKDVQQSLCELQKYWKMNAFIAGGPRCKYRVFNTEERELEPEVNTHRGGRQSRR